MVGKQGLLYPDSTIAKPMDIEENVTWEVKRRNGKALSLIEYDEGKKFEVTWGMLEKIIVGKAEESWTVLDVSRDISVEQLREMQHQYLDFADL